MSLEIESLNDLAIMYHELFLSFVKAGFKRNEALELVKAHLTVTATLSANKGAQNSDGD